MAKVERKNYKGAHHEKYVRKDFKIALFHEKGDSQTKIFLCWLKLKENRAKWGVESSLNC